MGGSNGVGDCSGLALWPSGLGALDERAQQAVRHRLLLAGGRGQDEAILSSHGYASGDQFLQERLIGASKRALGRVSQLASRSEQRTQEQCERALPCSVG